MSDKPRLITLGVVVFIFVVGNIVAGYYKWGASRETPNRLVQLKDTAEDISNQKKQKKELTNEPDAVKGPAAAGEKTASVETDLDSVKADIQAQIAALKEENAALLSTKQTDKDLAAENSKLREQLQAVLQSKQTLEKENDELRSAEKKNQKIAAGQSELQQEQVVTYKKEITGLRNELRDKQNLVNQNRQLSEKVQEYSNTSIKLEKRISELQDQIDQYQNLDTENQKLKAKLEASNKQIKSLKARLDEIRKMVAAEEKSDQ